MMTMHVLGVVAWWIGTAVGVAVLDRYTRTLGQRWAARIDAWFDRKLGDGR